MQTHWAKRPAPKTWAPADRPPLGPMWLGPLHQCRQGCLSELTVPSTTSSSRLVSSRLFSSCLCQPSLLHHQPQPQPLRQPRCWPPLTAAGQRRQGPPWPPPCTPVTIGRVCAVPPGPRRPAISTPHHQWRSVRRAASSPVARWVAWWVREGQAGHVWRDRRQQLELLRGFGVRAVG